MQITSSNSDFNSDFFTDLTNKFTNILNSQNSLGEKEKSINAVFKDSLEEATESQQDIIIALSDVALAASRMQEEMKNKSQTLGLPTFVGIQEEQNAKNANKTAVDSVLSVIENASTSESLSQRSLDGKRAASAMLTEMEAEANKENMFVLKENQENYEQEVENITSDAVTEMQEIVENAEGTKSEKSTSKTKKSSESVSADTPKIEEQSIDIKV